MTASSPRRWRLDEIVSRLGGVVDGDPATEICAVAPIERAGLGDITFLSNPKFRSTLATSPASAVVLAADAANATTRPKIVVANPYAYYARLVGLVHVTEELVAGVDPSAVVNSQVPSTVWIGAHSVIGRGVTLGARTRIGPGCIIGDGVAIGDDGLLHAAVTIGAGCRIGARVVVQSGAVIGSDGFGFARENGVWVKIPQIGGVSIGDDVEIGANTTIDRGALDDTVIGNDVKLDNQIQVAHNVHIGEHTAIAGCVGIAGSTRIGRRCTIGGAAMIIGHLEIADDVHVSSGTLISKNIREPGHYTGVFPTARHEVWAKNTARVRHLDEMHRRLRELEKQVEALLASRPDETDKAGAASRPDHPTGAPHE